MLKARNSLDNKERTQLYMKAQEVFKKDLPWTTIAHSTVNQPMRKEVSGFKISPFGDYNFEGVSVKLPPPRRLRRHPPGGGAGGRAQPVPRRPGSAPRATALRRRADVRFGGCSFSFSVPKLTRGFSSC